jgi:hypothetical protein
MTDEKFEYSGSKSTSKIAGYRDVLLFSNLLFYNSYLVVAVATCYSFLEVTG